MKNKFIKNFLLFGLLFLIILFFTYGLSGNFFQQDEWGAFGDIIYSYNQPWWSIFISKGVHFLPFGLLFWLGLYKAFALNAQYYVLVELILHAFASLLVFIFISKISKNNIIGLITAILFATNGRAYEGFMHLAIFSTTITSFIFILLFFIYLINIKGKYFSVKNILILISLFFSSVFFREDGFFIVPLSLLYLVLFDKEKFNKKNIKSFLIFGISLLFFFILRVLAQSFNITPIPDGSKFSFGSVIYNLVTLPIKLTVQNIISGSNVFHFLTNRTLLFYPTMPSFLQAYAIYMDFVFVLIFNLIMWIFIPWIYFLKNKNKRSYVIFFSSWIILSVIYLSLVGRRLYMVEERYLYFSSVPVLFFIAFFVFHLFFSNYKNKIIKFLNKCIALIIVFTLLYTSYNEIQTAVKYKVGVAHARKSFLNNLLSVHPRIPNNTIFYIKCKEKCYRNSEFGLSPDWVLPFTSGPGWNILVMYSIGNEKTWGKFLTNNFLLNLNSQGYKRVEDRSFGYYINKNDLKKTLKEQNLSSDIVIALEYDEKDFSVRDISKSFRKELNEN